MIKDYANNRMPDLLSDQSNKWDAVLSLFQVQIKTKLSALEKLINKLRYITL